MLGRRDTPENLWVKYPDTGEMIYRPDLEGGLWVTPSGHHMRIGARTGCAITFDDGQLRASRHPTRRRRPAEVPRREALCRPPEGGPQGRPASRTRCPSRSATSKGVPVVVIVQDFAFMGGSLGMGAGEAFISGPGGRERGGRW